LRALLGSRRHGFDRERGGMRKGEERTSSTTGAVSEIPGVARGITSQCRLTPCVGGSWMNGVGKVGIGWRRLACMST
jgi:hypothetical protein